MIDSIIKSTLAIKWSHIGMVLTASGSVIALDMASQETGTVDITTLVVAITGVLAVLVSLYTIINTSRNDIAKNLNKIIDTLQKSLEKKDQEHDEEIKELNEQINKLNEAVEFERNLRIEWETKYNEVIKSDSDEGNSD